MLDIKTLAAAKKQIEKTNNNDEFNAHIKNSNIHITSEEREKLNKDFNDQVPTFTQADSRENIASGEKLSTIFGKIKKWLADLKTVAFTGSYNDLADKPEIPEKVRVKGNAESSYRTGNVNLTPENVGAPSNEYMGEHFVADCISHSGAAIKARGWYRIAKSPLDCYFSCTISLKRGYSYNAPEYQMIQLLDTYEKKKFVSLIAQSSSHIWKKIRLTRNREESMNYIEIYQDTSTGLANDWSISVWDAVGIGRGNWKAITPVLTEEAVDGVAVLATLDLPAEFDPSHNIMDADNNSNISLSYHKPGLDSADWLSAWNGYELRSIAPSKVTGVGSAVKATQDGDGNVIKDTYAKKSIYGDSAVSMGRKSGTTVGSDSFAFGWDLEASGGYSHAEGTYNTASGNCSHVEGSNNMATGESSHAEGDSTRANNYSSHASGKYNKLMANGGKWNNQVGDVFVIGNGTSSNERSNALRVTYLGDVMGTKAFQSSGADYAEFIKPWWDGNQDGEDRVGYFVAVKDGFLHKAQEGDYVIGITSGNPSVVGNADEDYYWRYERDKFNRIIMENVPEMVQQTDDEGNLIFNDETHEPIMVETGNIIKNARMKLAEGYDPTLQDSYIPRAERPEWSYVGMIGVLPVRDDGTCIPGQFSKCGTGGIATFAENRGVDTFFVIERISDNIVSVILK